MMTKTAIMLWPDAEDDDDVDRDDNEEDVMLMLIKIFTSKRCRRTVR